MKTNTPPSRKLTISILSLSLLTVMAGAAVAPALHIIQLYFSDVNQTLVQMIISTPALFIFLTNMIFPKLCRTFKTKQLLIAALLLYTAGGAVTGIFSNIFVILVFRALVGVGVGIIMPLSTGLLAYYFNKDQQDRLMGYSSAMNSLGGVIAVLISGLLATISWRLSFLVYLMGLISIVLCLIFLPSEKISQQEGPRESGVFKKYYMLIIAMFLLMFSFFVYPAAFAMEAAKEAILPDKIVPIIMAGMDVIAFIGGLTFARIKKHWGMGTKFLSPALFLIGYVLLFALGGWIGALAGSVGVGFACGVGIPFIMSTAGQKAGRAAATTVMPMVSMAMYLSQFVTPMILGAANTSPYLVAAISSALLLVWSAITIRK